MSWTLCSSGAIVRKAGANANSTAAASGALLVDYYNQAEAEINAISRYDWTTNFSSLTPNTLKLLEQIISNLGGVYLIQYDMSGYTSRGEAESMIVVLRDAALRGISLIKDQKRVEFMD